jgi:hypothetical protein
MKLRAHRREARSPDPDAFVFGDVAGRPLDPDRLRRHVLYPALRAAGIPVQRGRQARILKQQQAPQDTVAVGENRLVAGALLQASASYESHRP